METVYRNYGALGNRTAPNNEISVNPRRQVYEATHKGDGTRLPFMNRSFISFTYGGKPIEDFDLIATIVSNRLTRNGYANFEDIVTTYDNLDGQFYWNTHYKTNSLTLVLSTDGIEQKTLDEFMFWFHAGEAKELVLSEHPNRAIMARVAQPPQISMLPFEQTTYVTISDQKYPTKTTLYKGDITLDFVMDEPHWYAIQNILGREDTERHRYVDEWIDINGNVVDIFASQDALKILVEDGIPLGSMIDNNMLLGNGAFANVENNVDSLIWSLPEEEIEYIDGEPTGEGARIYGVITDEEYAENSRLVMASEALQWLSTEDENELFFDKEEEIVTDYREYHPVQYKGIIAGPIVDISGNGIVSLAPNANGYFFYAGTAPAPTILSFTLTPKFSENGYFMNIFDSITNSSQPYNTITVESKSKQDFRITTPNVVASYNLAVQILSYYYGNTNMVQLRDMINEQIKHPAVRAWVNSLLSDDESNADAYANIARKMTSFFRNDEEELMPMRFTFNSKTGEARGDFYYRRPTRRMSLLDIVYEDNALNKLNTIRTKDNNLTNVQRYENLLTWHWEQYCIDNNGDLVVPDPTDEDDCDIAIRAFINYTNTCIENGPALPTIFTINDTEIASSELLSVTEDVGDMLRSNDIIIRDRNYPTSNGKIKHWEDSEIGHTYSHRIYHDMSENIENLQLWYRNMYL